MASFTVAIWLAAHACFLAQHTPQCRHGCLRLTITTGTTRHNQATTATCTRQRQGPGALVCCAAGCEHGKARLKAAHMRRLRTMRASTMCQACLLLIAHPAAHDTGCLYVTRPVASCSTVRGGWHQGRASPRPWCILMVSQATHACMQTMCLHQPSPSERPWFKGRKPREVAAASRRPGHQTGTPAPGNQCR